MADRPTATRKEKPPPVPGKKTKEELRGQAKLPPKVHATTRTPAQVQADADLAKAQAEEKAAGKGT
jgi:hypothetical protein